MMLRLPPVHPSDMEVQLRNGAQRTQVTPVRIAPGHPHRSVHGRPGWGQRRAREQVSVHGKEHEPTGRPPGAPRAAHPANAGALVVAYVRAQEAELVVRWLLARDGIPAGVAVPVATLDARGRPAVRVVLNTTEQTHISGSSLRSVP